MILTTRLSICDQQFVAHNQHNDLAEKIQQNSLSKVDEFILWDLTYNRHLQMNDASVNLITLFMSLHHVSSHWLAVILNEIYHILHPDDIFLIHKHDEISELMSMLEVTSIKVDIMNLRKSQSHMTLNQLMLILRFMTSVLLSHHIC